MLLLHTCCNNTEMIVNDTVLSCPQVFNNGHTIQVQWKGKLKSDVKILAKDTVLDVLNATASDKLKSFPLTPLQFHFHTTSEHTVDGKEQSSS